VRALRADSRCVLVFTLRADFYGAFLTSSLWTDNEGRISRIDLGPIGRDSLLALADYRALSKGARTGPYVLVNGVLSLRALDDMSTPVTRGELRAELEQFEIRLEQRLEQRLGQKLEQKLEQKLAHLVTKAELEQKLAPLATKAELELWGGALLARMTERMESLEQRLLVELASHTKAISESMSAQIAVIDEKYADLPPRASRLETEVFARKQR